MNLAVNAVMSILRKDAEARRLSKALTFITKMRLGFRKYDIVKPLVGSIKSV